MSNQDQKIIALSELKSSTYGITIPAGTLGRVIGSQVDGLPAGMAKQVKNPRLVISFRSCPSWFVVHMDEESIVNISEGEYADFTKHPIGCMSQSNGRETRRSGRVAIFSSAPAAIDLVDHERVAVTDQSKPAQVSAGSGL